MRRKRQGQIVVVPSAEVIDTDEKMTDEESEGIMTAPLDAIPAEKWSVHPPSRIEPENKIDEFPLPPVWSFSWSDEWDDILSPPYPDERNNDEVNIDDATTNSRLGSSTVA